MSTLLIRSRLLRRWWPALPDTTTSPETCLVPPGRSSVRSGWRNIRQPDCSCATKPRTCLVLEHEVHDAVSPAAVVT